VDHNFLTYAVTILTNAINIVPRIKIFQMFSNLRLENSVFYTRKILHMSLVACFAGVILLSVMSVNTIVVVAQIPSIPSVPTEDDENDNQQLPITDNPSSPTSASNMPPPTILITSLEDGQEVPVGELTIKGTSSDDEESNCQVYADVNDITPLQNATAAGANGGEDDYSQWTFTYTEDYQLITEGANELTAKISCFDGNSPTPMSKWHSINVTGVTTGAPLITAEPTDEGTNSTDEEVAPDAIEIEENEGLGDIMPGVPPSG
jgi:hypothetical protein